MAKSKAPFPPKFTGGKVNRGQPGNEARPQSTHQRQAVEDAHHCVHGSKRHCRRHCRRHGWPVPPSTAVGSDEFDIPYPPVLDNHGLQRMDVPGEFECAEQRPGADRPPLESIAPTISAGIPRTDTALESRAPMASAMAPRTGAVIHADLPDTSGSSYGDLPAKSKSTTLVHVCRRCRYCRPQASVTPKKGHRGGKQRRRGRRGHDEPRDAISATTSHVIQTDGLDGPQDGLSAQPKAASYNVSVVSPGVSAVKGEAITFPEVDNFAKLLSTTPTPMEASPRTPSSAHAAATLPESQAARADNVRSMNGEPQTSLGYDVNQPMSSIGPKGRKKASFASNISESRGRLDDQGHRKLSQSSIVKKPQVRKDQRSRCPPRGVDYSDSLPMMSPGAATLLNIDKALAPKGPSPLPGDVFLGYGRFQLMILACAQLSVAVDAYQRLSARLLSPSVDHWCRPPGEFAKLSPHMWRNVGLPLGSDGRYNQCAVYEPLLGDTQPLHGHDSQRAVVLCEEWDYDLPPGVQTMVSRWNLVCGKAWQVTLVAVYNILSGSIMLPLAGQLSDKVGRRNVINLCVVLAVCAGLAVSHASSLFAFVVSRLFVGASLSTLHVNTVVLLFEVAAPSHRDLYCSIAHLGFVVGSVVASALEGLVLDVQIVEAVAIMPASLLVVCFYAVEDSPMWLLATWNFARAKKTLLWMSRVNGVSSVSIDMPGLEQQYKLKQAEELRPLHRVSVLDMLINECLRKRVCLMMCVWFCLLFAMQGVWQYTPKHTDFWLVLTAVVPRTAALPAAYTLLRTSSRKAALGMCVALSCCLSFALAFLTLLAPPRNKNVVVLLCELTLSSLVMTYTVVILHSLEMFPTVLRTMTICTVLSVGRIGAALSAGIEVAAERLHRSVPLFLGALSLVIAQVVLVSLPETKYSQLPNTLYDLEADVVKHVVLDILQTSTHNTAVEATKNNTAERK